MTVVTLTSGGRRDAGQQHPDFVDDAGQNLTYGGV